MSAGEKVCRTIPILRADTLCNSHETVNSLHFVDGENEMHRALDVCPKL